MHRWEKAKNKREDEQQVTCNSNVSLPQVQSMWSTAWQALPRWLLQIPALDSHMCVTLFLVSRLEAGRRSMLSRGHFSLSRFCRRYNPRACSCPGGQEQE